MYYWLIFIGLEILRNRWMRVRGIKPNYKASLLFRGGFAILHGSLIVGVYDFGSALTTILFQVSSFYLVFDFILNWWTGDRWNYQGKSSGYLDKLPMWAYLGLKGLCLVYLIWFMAY